MAFIGRPYTYRPALRLLDKHSYGTSNAALWDFFLSPEVYRIGTTQTIGRTATYTTYDYVNVLGCWAWAIRPDGERAASRVGQLVADNISDGVTTQTTFTQASSHYYTVANDNRTTERYQALGPLNGNIDTTPSILGSFKNNSFWASDINWGTTASGAGLVPITAVLPIGAWCNYMYNIHNPSGIRVTFECLMGACKKEVDQSGAFLHILRNDDQFYNNKRTLSSTAVNPAAERIFTPGKEYGAWSDITYQNITYQYDSARYSSNEYRDLYLTPMLDSDPSGAGVRYQCGSLTMKITVTGIY